MFCIVDVIGHFNNKVINFEPLMGGGGGVGKNVTLACLQNSAGWVNDPQIYHLEMKKMFLVIRRVSGSLLIKRYYTN